MPPAVASALYPVTRRFVGWGKELTPGTSVAPTFTVPVTKFDPKDNITYLKDTAWRNAMAELYGMVQGTTLADVDFEGPFFGDAIGYPLTDIWGDYWQGVNGTAGTATTLSGAYTPPGTTISVTSATGITVGSTFAVGTLGTPACEVRTAATVVGTTVTLSSPLYQSHLTGAPVTPFTSVTTYVHNWSLLNAGVGAGGSQAAQPPTYSVTDYTGVTASTGARVYAYTCLSELNITGTSTALLIWDAKGQAWASAVSGATPTASLTTVRPQASWQSIVTVGGTQVNTFAEWKATFTRKIDPKFTNSGQQDPFGIARGEMSCMLNLVVDPATDESQFLNYLNNTQPPVVITAGNGLTGANLVQLVISMNQAAYDTGAIDASKTVFGYQLTAQAVANSVNAGPSGGLSPCSVQVTNAVVSY
jgi:hypothetical protein